MLVLIMLENVRFKPELCMEWKEEMNIQGLDFCTCVNLARCVSNPIPSIHLTNASLDLSVTYSPDTNDIIVISIIIKYQ